jgi:glutathione S-transferase
MSYTLFIGDKNTDAWSMGPWVLMKQAGIAFNEQPVRNDGPESADVKKTLRAITPLGKLPVLIDPSLGSNPSIWDSLAMCEYLAEVHPELNLWPANRTARSRARSLCAEMHAGFTELRSLCPMNIEVRLPSLGQRLVHTNNAFYNDLNRLVNMWQTQLKLSGGPMLFGEFSIADAYFVSMCMRIRTYALPVSPTVQAYISRIVALPSVAEWMAKAVQESNFLIYEEPCLQA